MNSDFIIIPVHNRRNYTLKCLQNLHAIGDLEKYTVVVVDDGSTDGTSELISKEYPEVTILTGSGYLYWTGSIEMGMKYAIDHGAECVIWLNDDSSVPQGAIARLAEVAKKNQGMASALGFVNQHTIREKWYFPVQKKTLLGIKPNEVTPNSGLIPSDACRGNLVAISRHVVEKIGYPDGTYIPHVAGDTDYSLRVSSAGLPCVIVTDVLLEELCTIRNDNDSWLLGDTGIATIWKRVYAKKSALRPRTRWIYLTRHWGLVGAIQFPKPYIYLLIATGMRILIPRNVLIFIFGRFSHEWNASSWRRELK